MRMGVVILPEDRWRAAEQRWRRAEELGFAHAWTYDHLTWRSFRDSAWFAAVPTLTAAAAVTTHIRLGTLVASPNFRHPVPLAKELITLDDVSGGRIDFGVGAGGTGHDVEIMAAPPMTPRERADRFTEFVELIDMLLRQPATSFQGRYYAANGARTYPGCVQQPRIPFTIAGPAPRGMRLAARLGEAWLTNGPPGGTEPLSLPAAVVAVRDQLAAVDRACAEVGRDPASLRRAVVTGGRLPAGLGSVDQFRDTVGRYAELGITDMIVHWPRTTEPYAGDAEVFTAAVTAVVSEQ